MMSRPIFHFLLIIGLLGNHVFAGEMRTWTDISGREIEAEMTSFANGEVGFKLKDSGKEIRFPFARLSEEDRGYVRENAPVNLKTAARQIDQMVWDRLKVANSDIKTEGAALVANKDIDGATRNKELARLAHMEKMTHPTKPLTDEQFLRRIYLDLAGRIPTYKEADTFFRTPSKTKRAELIDNLIESEAFVSHFFNYMSDLLRIRDGISMGGFNNLKAGAYADWVKDQIREDKPWNQLVGEMVEARGYLWENPATGYMLTDFGMELCNLSNTFTTFLGTEITCAQCHDHPFEEVYQMDFYRMASFFGNLKFKANPDKDLLKLLGAKKKQFAAEAKKAKKSSNDLNAFMDAYTMYVGDSFENNVRLPFDYKYDNGEPNTNVKPATYFGEIVDIEKHGTPRMAFAAWIASEKNPRFTINIVNRLWKHVYGVAQIEPVHNIPGHLGGQAQNYELLKFLESLMKEVDYSVKDFLKILYKTQTYQREACHESPTLTMIDKGEFHFPAPILRRMSAEQLWDSLVAMSVPEPESPERRTRILDDYRNVMSADWKNMNFEQAEKVRAKFNNLGKPTMMNGGAKKGKNTGPVMIRASEMRMPSNLGSFLYQFGQSDKKFIENANTEGTIPQVMMLLNGSLTNQIMTNNSKALVRIAQAEDSKDNGIDVVFLSILSRRPRGQDRDLARPLVRGSNGGKADYSDLVWALLNTREFMFIQ